MLIASGECSASSRAIAVACLMCSPGAVISVTMPHCSASAGVESPTPQHQIARTPRTRDPGDPCDPARGGQDADADLWEPENRCGVGDSDVSGKRQFEPAAKAVAGDGDDGRLAQRGEHLVHRHRNRGSSRR